LGDIAAERRAKICLMQALPVTVTIHNSVCGREVRLRSATLRFALSKL
jgi:hypothetical protein